MRAFFSTLITTFLFITTLAQAADRPNVILIYTDDQGTVDAGCYGATDLHTPHLDALAASGIRFTQMYAPAPVCSPSRAGLLTGRYPVRAGVPGNVSSQPGHPGMPGDQTTIAETFRAAGYKTAHIGKWHLGYSPETMPNAQGFDYSFGHMGGCIDNYSHFFYWSGPNRHDLHENGMEIHRPGEFFPDLMVDHAETFMTENQDQPFFMYFASNTPHYPLQGDPEWLARYDDAGVPYPRNLYAAFLSTFDERLGRLLKTVDDLGLRDNTIVVYMSDHGHSVEERTHGGGGSAGPYRGAKFSLFEGGIRVPAVIRWPGHIPAGETRDQIVHGSDWLPTLAAFCNVPLLNPDVDGKNITPVLHSADAPTPHDVLHWHVGRGDNAQWAVRQGDWKLIGNPQDPVHPESLGRNDTLFLVNLAEDPAEQTNLADMHPKRVMELKGLHEDWYESAARRDDFVARLNSRRKQA